MFGLFRSASRRRSKENEEGALRSIEEDPELRTFCVSHEAPLVPNQLSDFIIGIGDYHPPEGRGAHISGLDPFWDAMRPYSYGAAGNYVIPNAMASCAATRLTGVFSHRKIIVRSDPGRRSAHSPFYWDVTVDEATRLPREEIRPRKGFDFLIGFPTKCKISIVAQYIFDHHGIDLFDYISMAVKMGLLPADEAQAFATEQFFVCGGCELGIYPTQWVRPILEGLAQLGREFVTTRRDRISTYDPYQVRAVGFLAERLGSYLLLSELRRRYPHGIPSEICGYLVAIVSKGETYIPAVVPNK